jgi:hypothetical protein
LTVYTNDPNNCREREYGSFYYNGINDLIGEKKERTSKLNSRAIL